MIANHVIALRRESTEGRKRDARRDMLEPRHAARAGARVETKRSKLSPAGLRLDPAAHRRLTCAVITTSSWSMSLTDTETPRLVGSSPTPAASGPVDQSRGTDAALASGLEQWGFRPAGGPWWHTPAQRDSVGDLSSRHAPR